MAYQKFNIIRVIDYCKTHKFHGPFNFAFRGLIPASENLKVVKFLFEIGALAQTLTFLELKSP